MKSAPLVGAAGILGDFVALGGSILITPWLTFCSYTREICAENQNEFHLLFNFTTLIGHL